MLKHARACLESAQSVYLACHVIPDGDAVGSLLGLGMALRRLGKPCTMACADSVPAKYRFLAGAGEIVPQPPTSEQVIVTVDSSDVERLGNVYDEEVFHSRPVINIDHHVTNTHFGTLNVVQLLPSTSEIVFSLLKSMAVAADADTATALLTGLVTDTRCFRTGNVTARQLRTTVALMRAGASLADVTELVFNREPVSTICLWGQALASVQTRGRMIWTEIDQGMMRRCRATPMEADGLSSFLASAETADAAVVFREKDDGQIETSMRAGPARDVSGVALKLGGGGHPRAAGCTLPGPMSAARERVLGEIEAALREQAQPRSPSAGAATGKTV
jgi:phosphoesterase RecJ-like protein